MVWGLSLLPGSIPQKDYPFLERVYSSNKAFRLTENDKMQNKNVQIIILHENAFIKLALTVEVLDDNEKGRSNGFAFDFECNLE